MMSITWKVLTPMAFSLLIVVSVVYKFVENTSMWIQAPVLFIVNVVLFIASFAILKKFEKRKERKVVSSERVLAQPSNPFSPSETGG